MKKTLLKKNIFIVLILGSLLLVSYPISALNQTDTTFIEKTITTAPLDHDWWPTYRHDNENVGYTTNTPPDDDTLLWTYQTNDGISSSPTVIHGKVYVGSWDFTFYCFDMETGAVIWEYMTGGRITGSAAVMNNRVYFGSRDSYIYCLDANDGSLLWSFETGYYIESSPALLDGEVYIGSADGNFYCLDAIDGSVIWEFSTNNIIWSSPALYQGNVYFGSLSGIFYCLDSATGALLWEYTTGSGIWSSPAIYNGRVYIGSNDYILYCFDYLTGNLIWDFTTTNEIHSSPAIAYGYLYIGTNDGILYCLNITNGAEQWTYTISGTIQSSPAIADGKVYLGYEACCGFPSFVACLDANDGSVIWDYNIGMPGMQSSPAITLEKLFTCSLDGIIRVFGDTPYFADAQGPYQTNINISLQFNGMAYGGIPGYTWYWEFGDEATSTQQNPIHTYTEEGTYDVILTVTDSQNSIATDETTAVITSQNTPPTPPQISGPSKGKPGVEYTYTFQSNDSENEDIYYWVNWGDSCPAIEWEGPFLSADTLSLNHTYEEEGAFTIRSQAKDIHDLESDWSYFETSMPKPIIIQQISPLLHRIIIQFLKHILPFFLYQKFVL